MATKKEIFERIGRFIEEKKVERHQLMVRKEYINSDIPYSDKLWDDFKTKWLANKL